jgi:hypothetical protein
MLDGPNTGLIQTFNWNWTRPQLDILWRNEANPSSATKHMLNEAALRVSKTGTDVAVGSSDHQGGFPPPFGIGGGKWPPNSGVPTGPAPKPAPKSKKKGGRAGLATAFGGGRTAGWRRYLVADGRLDPNIRGAISLAAGSSGATQAWLTTNTRASRMVTIVARLKITRARLPKTGDRKLFSVSGPSGARDVGIVRTIEGQLRWASWTTIAGRRRGLAIGKRVRLNRWLSIRFSTDWRKARPRDVVTVGRTVLVKNTGGVRPDSAASSLWMGVGHSFTPQAGGPTSVLVKSVRVSTVK